MGGNSPEAIIKVLNFLCTTKKVRALTQPLTQFSLDFQTIAVQIRHVDCWSDSLGSIRGRYSAHFTPPHLDPTLTEEVT